MIKVLVLADDVTGALDAGVKFSDAGLKTKVSLLLKIEEMDTDASVLVLCVPTRHETPEAAYRQVRALSARAAEKHIGCIFKKRCAATSAQNSPRCSTAAVSMSSSSSRRCRR